MSLIDIFHHWVDQSQICFILSIGNNHMSILRNRVLTCPSKVSFGKSRISQGKHPFLCSALCACYDDRISLHSCWYRVHIATFLGKRFALSLSQISRWFNVRSSERGLLLLQIFHMIAFTHIYSLIYSYNLTIKQKISF